MAARRNLIIDPKGVGGGLGWTVIGGVFTTVTLADLGIIGQPDGLLTAMKYQRTIGGQTPPTSDALAVSGGVSYAARFTAYAPTTPASYEYLLLTFYADAGCTVPCGIASAYTVAPYAAGWSTLEVVARAPSTAVAAKLVANRASTTYTSYYTGFQFEPATAVMPYTDGDTVGWEWDGAANASASSQVVGTGLTGMEQVISEMAAGLAASMAVKVAALNAEYGDSLLATPAYYTEFDADEAKRRPGAYTYPCVVLMPLEDDPYSDQDIGAGLHTEHRVQLSAVFREPDVLKRQKLRFRWARAAREILTDDSALTLGKCYWRGTDWSDRALTLSNKSVLGEVVSLFAVRADERA